MEQTRRAHPRYATSLSVDVFTADDEVPAIAKNLSLGGLGIALKSPVTPQTEVGLSLFLVEDGIEDERTAPVNLRGTICWCTPDPKSGGYLAGLQFSGLQPADGQRIQEFLRRLSGGR
jgi:hypothetical protein